MVDMNDCVIEFFGCFWCSLSVSSCQEKFEFFACSLRLTGWVMIRELWLFKNCDMPFKSFLVHTGCLCENAVHVLHVMTIDQCQIVCLDNPYMQLVKFICIQQPLGFKQVFSRMPRTTATPNSIEFNSDISVNDLMNGVRTPQTTIAF